MSQPERGAGRGGGGARRHLTTSLADMVRSVVVLLGLVVVVVLLAQWLFSTDGEQDRRAVEWREPLADARSSATFPVWAPATLPKGWRATTVRFEPGEQGRWHLGVQTADDEYVGLEVSPVAERRMVERFAGRTEAAGDAEVAGTTWSLRTGDGETTLVRDDDGTTVLVTGTAPRAQIESYAAGLTSG